MKKLKEWEQLPSIMQTKEVYVYYEALKKKQQSMFIKTVFDKSFSVVLLFLLLPVMFILAVLIKLDSEGPVFYRQVRVTQYGRKFKIYKFRTMTQDAEKKGSQLTSGDDMRITCVGKKLRKLRLDEIPQLFNVIAGDMSFVGARPEVPYFVKKYTKVMWASLLMPAGITGKASIEFRNEEKLYKESDCIEEVYIRKVLPEKMKYNLDYIKHFNFFNDIKIMIQTLAAVVK